MKLLDLFCGEGGASVGYARAGFEVTGVDHLAQPRYPFPLVVADALDVLDDRDFIAGFDAIAASPPCQAYSITRRATGRSDHPMLIAPTLERLRGLPQPWVVENVPGATFAGTYHAVACGAAFGLTALDVDGAPLVLRRHRLFASSTLILMPPCSCASYRRGWRVAGAYGGGANRPGKTNMSTGYRPQAPVVRRLLGVEWMSRAGASQAIPPAYTEHIGHALAAAVSGARTPL